MTDDKNGLELLYTRMEELESLYEESKKYHKEIIKLMDYIVKGVDATTVDVHSHILHRSFEIRLAIVDRLLNVTNTIISIKNGRV